MDRVKKRERKKKTEEIENWEGSEFSDQATPPLLA
jgi:hypothetical protein